MKTKAQIKATKRMWYLKNRTYILKKGHAYYKRNKQERLAYQIEYARRKKEQNAAGLKQSVQDAADRKA
jgi:hypothetical protein